MTPAFPARALRAFAVLALASAGVTCRDAGPTGPARLAPSAARVAFAAALAADAPGTPLAPYRRARVQLFTLPGEALARDTTITFADGDTTSTVSIGVVITTPTQQFLLGLTLLDDADNVVYSARDTVVAFVPGSGATPPPPRVITLVYAGPDTVVRGLSVAPRDSTLTAGDAVRYRAVATRADGSPVAGAVIGFSARGSGIAVDVDGTVHATAPVPRGGTFVIARLATGLSDSTLVTVVARPISVTVAPDSSLLVTGATLQLDARVRDATGAPIDGLPLGYTSADVTVATVSPAGLVTAVSPGTTTVTARFGTLSAVAKIVVVPVPVARIVLTPAGPIALLVDSSRTIVAEAQDAAGTALSRPVTWTSAAAAIASVAPDASGRGVVTAHAAGTTTITASAGGQSASLTVTVSVPTPNGPASIVISPASATLASLGELVSLSATVRDANGNVLATPVTYASRDAAVATVAADGTVRSVGNGATWVVASAGTVADSARITVRQLVDTILVSRDTVTLAVGDTATVVATPLDRNRNPIADVAPAFSSLNTSIATVTAAGQVTLVTSGATQVLASAGGHSTAVVVQGGQGTGGVVAKLAWIRVTPGSGSVRMGGTLPLVAELVDASGAATAITPQWASDQPGRAPVSAAGVVTLVDTTTVTITATSQGIAGHATFTVLAAPALNAFSFAPTTLSGVSTSTVRFSVSIGAADPGAGIGGVQVEFTGPTGATQGCSAAAPTVGTSRRGTWDCAVSIPAGSAAGTWHATRVSLTGTSSLVLGESELSRFGATTLTVTP